MCDGFGDSHHKMNKNRHLGMHQDEYLPLNRGFDNFYGVRMKRSVTTLCATLLFVALILRAAHNAYPLRRLSTQILTGGGSHTKHISVSQQVIARGETGKSVYTGANLWDNDAFSMDNQLPTHTTELYTKKALQVVQHLEQAGTTPWFLYLSFQAIHDPIEVGDEKFITETKCNDIDEALSSRRIMCGMMAEVDDGILQIRGSLEHMTAWERTVFVYASDNGGLTTHGSSNAPFRGEKGTYWEGGVHVPAFVGGGYISSALAAAGREAFTMGGLAHITDLHATIASIAGYDLAHEEKMAGIKLDGVDLWDSLVPASDEVEGARSEVLINMNSALFANSAALRVGDYKMMVNADPKESSIYMTVKAHLQTAEVELSTPDLIKFATQQTSYILDGKTYLFNLALNPTEQDLDEDTCGDDVKETCRNLAGDPDFADIEQSLLSRVEEFKIAAEPSTFAWQDDGPLANPALFGNLWSPWRDSNGDPKALFLGLNKVVDDASTELTSSFQAAFAKSSNSEIITAVTAGGALLALVATVAFKAGRRDRHASYQPVNDYPLA